MKIICVGLNYREHIRELGHKKPSEPLFFCKPDTSLLRNNDPFYIPDFTNELQYEGELVVKINRVVKSIDARFASRCYDEVAVGVDFTARDLQRKAIEAGHPWEKCKAFDKSSPVPNTFIPLEELGGNVNNLNFELKINGETRQKANTADMIFNVDEIIAYISKFMTLKIGDLIFTGTPVGVGKVNIGDRLETFLEGRQMLDIDIK